LQPATNQHRSPAIGLNIFLHKGSSGNVFVKGFTNPNSALFGLFTEKARIYRQEEDLIFSAI